MAIVAYRRPINVEDLTPNLRRRAIARDGIAEWSERQKRYIADAKLLTVWLSRIRSEEQGSEDAADVEEMIATGRIQ